MGSNADNSDDGGGVEEIDEVAGSLRNEQWVTYLLLTGAGLVVALVLVGSMVNRLWVKSDAFSLTGPALPDSEDGAGEFLRGYVVEQLEMKFATDEYPEVACEQRGEAKAGEPQHYTATVRCERSDTVMTIDVDLIHDGNDFDWMSEIRETEPPK